MSPKPASVEPELVRLARLPTDSFGSLKTARRSVGVKKPVIRATTVKMQVPVDAMHTEMRSVDKLVIVNVCHSGDSFALGPGTVSAAIGLYARALRKREPFDLYGQKIAVVGDGYIGRLTALMLKERYPEAPIVRWYTDRVPSHTGRKSGLVVPLQPGKPGGDVALEYVLKDSFDYWHAAADQPWWRRVLNTPKPGRPRAIDLFVTEGSDTHFRKLVDLKKMAEPKLVRLKFGDHPAGALPFLRYRTYLVDPPAEMRRLERELNKLDVRQDVQREIRDFRHIREVDARVVFDCTGVSLPQQDESWLQEVEIEQAPLLSIDGHASRSHAYALFAEFAFAPRGGATREGTLLYVPHRTNVGQGILTGTFQAMTPEAIDEPANMQPTAAMLGRAMELRESFKVLVEGRATAKPARERVLSYAASSVYSGESVTPLRSWNDFGVRRKPIESWLGALG